MILFVHRPDYYNPEDQPGVVQIIIGKGRNVRTGEVINSTRSCPAASCGHERKQASFRWRPALAEALRHHAATLEEQAARYDRLLWRRGGERSTMATSLRLAASLARQQAHKLERLMQEKEGDGMADARLHINENRLRVDTVLTDDYRDPDSWTSSGQEQRGVVRAPLRAIAEAVGAPLELVVELASAGVLAVPDDQGATFSWQLHAGMRGDPVKLVDVADGSCWYCPALVVDDHRAG
ncbi:hypothetical protein SNK04_014168 [Fusarium graminearum]